jgi:hypothetical protein
MHVGNSRFFVSNIISYSTIWLVILDSFITEVVDFTNFYFRVKINLFSFFEFIIVLVVNNRVH